jgi:signal transduction histidine kinase
MNAPDALELAAVAAGVTIGGLAIGAGALRVLRGRSIGAQIVALSWTTIASVLAGAYVASREMFIATHDLTVLVVVLVAAGAVAIVYSLLLGARIGGASRALAETARRIGDADSPAGRSTTPPRNVSNELSRLAQELATAQSRLAQARTHEEALERSRRELVAWVSHDLRTPLAGMRAIVEALQDRIVSDPETLDRYLATLHDEVGRLSALVDDLFELSRTQAGALRLQFERVSLADVVSDALAGSAAIAAAKHVTLEGHIVGPPPELDISTPEVLRVLRNLLENAIRHTPNDGSVVVEAGIDSGTRKWAYVTVRDAGGGVADDDLPRIFDVGYRHDGARTPGGGAGLGLAIAKGFVEAHHGEIGVRNAANGASFTVRLPLGRV